MPIVSGDIVWRLSGGAGNADPHASLGGVMSSTAWAGGVLHDLFDVVSGAENAASEAEYRCVYILNTHATLTWQSIALWIESETAGGADLAIGLDLAGVGDGSTTGVADSVADEDTAPDPAVTFSSPTTEGAGLVIGDLAPGEAHAVWLRRTAANTAALDNDGATLRARGDTAA